MGRRPPLRVLLVRHPEDGDVVSFEDAIVGAFQGGKEAGAYVASGEDLDIQLEVFSGRPPDDAPAFLERFCHTLTVVLVDTELLRSGGDNLFEWLAECFDHGVHSDGRHVMLVVSLEERQAEEFQRRGRLDRCQVAPAHEFGERAIRPGMVALRAVHEARLLLSHGLGRTNQLRLFISHAKLDGLPLAHALRHHIRDIHWLTAFYDADDLPPGCDWRRELEKGVGESLIVILRTEIYDTRYWCQQEVRWSDEYATPAVLFEARTGLHHPAGDLPFDRIPTVRIPDGNLMRILHLALREGLKFLLFVRRVEEMKLAGELPGGASLHAFSYQPSMAALLRACRIVVKQPAPRYLLYPDPVLGTGSYEAARALVHMEAPGVILATPQTLSAIP